MSTEEATSPAPVVRRRKRQAVRDAAVSLASILVVVGAIAFIQLLRSQDAGLASSEIPAGNYTAVKLGVVGGGSPRLGSPAPLFQLPVPDGKLVSLSESRGKVVLVNFWATWCVPCRQEIPDLVTLQQGWSDRAQIIGVDLQETPADVTNYANVMGMNYPLPIDFNGTVASTYKIKGLPTTFFLDAQGVIRDIRIGILKPQVATCIVDDIQRGQHDPDNCR